MSARLPHIPTTLILFLGLLISCSRGLIRIAVLQPAAVNIPEDIRSISILQVAGVPDPRGVFDSINQLALSPNYDYNTTKKGFIFGVYDELVKSPRFNRIVVTDSVAGSVGQDGIIGWNSLKTICRHDSTDGILLLKKTVTYDAISGSPVVEHSRDPRLWDDQEEFPSDQISYLRLINRTKWVFYQPDSGFRTEDLVYTDTIFYYDSGGIFLTKDYATIQQALYDACFFTGSDVGKMLAPAWNEEARRYYYIGPGKPLRKAARFIKHNNWEEAGQIWDSLVYNRNNILQYKASFNTALAWEQADDLDQALLWLNYADSLQHNHPLVKNYRTILEERIKERSLLERQMP